MLKFVLSALFFLIASLAAAQNATDIHCQQWITDTGRYHDGFGSIELSGPPLAFDTWSAEHSVMTMTFPGRVIVLTTDNVHDGALGDYIATTQSHREKGYEAFAVITDDTDGNRLGLIQPFSFDSKTHCFASVVRLKSD